LLCSFHFAATQLTPTSLDTQMVGIVLMLKPQLERFLQREFTNFNPETYAVASTWEQGEQLRVYYVKLDLGLEEPVLYLEAKQYSSGDVELSSILQNFPKMTDVKLMGESSRALVPLILRKFNDPEMRQFTTFDPQTYTSAKVVGGLEISVQVDVGNGNAKTLPILLPGNSIQGDGIFCIESRLTVELFLERIGIESYLGKRLKTFYLTGYTSNTDNSTGVTQYVAQVQVGNYETISVALNLGDTGGGPHIDYTYTCGTDNVPCGSPIPDVYKYFGQVVATASLAAGSMLSSIVTAWNSQPSPPFTITLSTIQSVYVISLTISSPPPTGVDWQITTQLFLGEWSDSNQHTSTITINKYSTGSITYPTISFP